MGAVVEEFDPAIGNKGMTAHADEGHFILWMLSVPGAPAFIAVMARHMVS